MDSVEPPQLLQVAPSLRAVSGRLSPERSVLVLGSFAIETGVGRPLALQVFECGGTCLLKFCLKEHADFWPRNRTVCIATSASLLN